MSTKRLLEVTVLEALFHSHHSVCKNVQKSMLTNVNMQRNDLPYFQMFAFSFFGGSFICRFLPIFCPPGVPRNSFFIPKIVLYDWLSITYICRYLLLRRKVDFAWESEPTAKKNIKSANKPL